MKKQMTAVLMVLFLILAGMPQAFASEGTAGDYGKGMGTKLGRGLWNVVSSPAEIPCTTSSDIKDKGGAGFFTGLGKGLVFMGRRIIVGVSEVLVFFMSPFEATLPPVCQESKASV